MRPRGLVLVLLGAVLLASTTRAALKDSSFFDRHNVFKRAVRPGPKGALPPVEEGLKAIRAFAETRDARVVKELFKAMTPLGRQVAKADADLAEATEALEKVQQPYFRTVEDYYRKHNKFPDTVLVITKDALEKLGNDQREAGRVHDGWIRLHEAVRSGLGLHLAALADDRDQVWKTTAKLGSGAKDPDVRRAFVASLRDLRGEDVEKVLLDVEKAEQDPAALVVTLEVLARHGTRMGFERIRQRLAGDGSDWRVVSAAAFALARYRHPETIPALVDRLRSAEGRLALDLFSTLFGITGKHLPDSHAAWSSWWTTDGEAFLKRWSDDKATRMTAVEDIGFADPKEIHVAAELAALLPTEPDAEVRAEILDNLAIHRSGFARETLLLALRDSDKDLRLAAIRGLAHYRHLAVPDALIRLVDGADKDELMAIFQALRTLWGGEHEFTVRSPNKESLHRWWENNKGRVGRHFIRLGARLRELAGGSRPPAAAEGAWKDRNFYGLRVMSKRVLFVVDISLSMEEPVREGQEQKKIEAAQAELKRVIPTLPDDATFGFVGFSGIAELWEKGMMPASPGNRRRALAFIMGLETKASTNIHDTLELAFQLGQKGTAYAGAGAPDTIFFVSDGAPTSGKVLDPDAILDYVRRWNEGRGIRIHCIGVGHDHDVDFLRKLAELTRGHYVAR